MKTRDFVPPKKAPTDSLALAEICLTVTSNPHRHYHVAILEISVRRLRSHLARGLRVLELQPHGIRIRSFQEVEQVARVETDRHRVSRVGRLDDVFRLARIRR